MQQPKQAVFVSYHRINRKIDFEKYKYEEGDLCVVKEKWKDEEGKIHKQIKCYENFERPFWITKKHHRKHKDKREWEDLDKLDIYKCPHHKLSISVQRALREFNPQEHLPIRIVNRNPYVYGTDFNSAFYLKELYGHKYNHYSAGFADVCVLDIETDVLGPNPNKIILLSIVMNKKAIVYALYDFISKQGLNYENEFFGILKDEVKEVYEQGYEVTLKVMKTEEEIFRDCFDTLHKDWLPDIVTGWNVMMFDQKVIATRMEELGLDPVDFFSSPDIPRKYQGYYYKEGKKFGISDSDKKTGLPRIARWHEVIAPASWLWVDAMNVFYQIRKHKGMLPSYRLDYILNKMIGCGKYEIEEAEKYKGIDKHIFMQKCHPVHYTVYNLLDCTRLDRMDASTMDLRSTFFVQLGDSEYRDYQSNPSKLAKDFHTFLYRNRGKVLGSTSDMMLTDWDKQLPPLKDWIVTLPTTHLEAIGLHVFKDAPEIKSNFVNHVADNDVESSYPKGGIATNMSRITTEIEVSEIIGIPMEDRYILGLNMLGGKVNATSNARLVHGLPHFGEAEKIFNQYWDEYQQAKGSQ